METVSSHCQQDLSEIIFGFWLKKSNAIEPPLWRSKGKG